jgi:hypothetical protein
MERSKSKTPTERNPTRSGDESTTKKRNLRQKDVLFLLFRNKLILNLEK